MAGTNTDITLSGKFISRWHSIPEKKWMLLLSAVVFIANIQIYWINTLFQDDYGLYYLWNQGGFSIKDRFGFAYINVLLTWTASKINFSLARSMVLVGVLIPAILLLFRILRKLGYPLPVALFAAGLIGFSPGQMEIPFFINGSYHAEAMLIMLIAFWGGMKFLEYSGGYRWGWYLFAILVLYWALHVSELIVPGTVAFTFAFLCWRRFEKKAWFFSASFVLLALYHTYFNILQNGRSAVQEAKPVTFEVFLKVFQNFMEWCLPTIHIGGTDSYMWMFFIGGICSLGLAIGIARGFVPETEPSVRRKNFDRRWAYIWRIIFPVILCLSALVVMTVAPWFRPRHALFPALGLYLLVSFSLYKSLEEYKYGKPFLVIILVGLTAVSMLQHYKTADNTFSYINRMHQAFMRFSATVNFPPDSQIVVVKMNPQTGGFWRWSTGYLQSSLNRKDVSGLLGDELMFIDPFAPDNFRAGGMNGLVPDKPLFLYRKTDNGFTQLTYFLQWKENSLDSDFTLYQTDPMSGKIIPIINGRGRANYQNVVQSLSKQGINSSDIMWGGQPSMVDRKRLGVPELSSVKEKGGFYISGGSIEKGGIGYILSSEKDKTAVALKKTDTPFKNIIKIKGQLKTALSSGVRNGFIVFGEDPKQLSHAVIFMGGQAVAIQGNFVHKVQKANMADPAKVFDVELTVDLKEGTVVWKVDGNETTTTFKVRPASINYIGYSAWSTKTEFSELQVLGN